MYLNTHWIRETFLAGSETREQPAARKSRHFRQQETILALIEEETGKDYDALNAEKGNLRRLAMDLLFRQGRLRGSEIGVLFEVGHSMVGQERKRLHENKAKNRQIEKLMRRLEDRLSTMKI